ncbi:MAG TPA: glutathione-independent formaldehyde dehydrogenase [Solirubrobacterales bacterium]|nr:glutathione-independent formaldehyde dehydrogenase [Solirubrobacterales bacterium]
MRAIVVRGERELSVETVPDATIEAPGDALLRITSSAICGTDLHIYDGRMGDVAGMVIGHEPLGIVEAVGSDVTNVRVGDRVVVPTHICCGFCAECVAGRSGLCLTNNPGSAGAAYGYPGMGGYRGCQAEYVRIPRADSNCLKLPGEAFDEYERDFVLLADAFPTGYHATELARVKAGDTVAIFGAGTIGLMAGLSARLRGAAEVYVVDYIAERLRRAEELGFEPVDFTAVDPVEEIRERLRATRRGRAYRGEEADLGVACGIDAIGFQARARAVPEVEDRNWVIAALSELVKPGGSIAIIGVFLDHDHGLEGGPEAKGVIQVPWGTLFKKGITVGLGRDHDLRYNRRLRDLIVAGRVRPSEVVSHELPLADGPEAFRRFDARQDGYLKVILHP